LPRHAIATTLAAALILSAASATPALADAGPGGFAIGTPQPGGASALSALSPVAVSSAAGTLSVQAGAMLGATVDITGSAAGAPAGRAGTIERQARDGSWATAVTATTGGDGSFRAQWRPDRTGQVSLRADMGDAAGATTAQTATLPTSTVTIYNPAVATWFGPGFYGRRTACGQRMSRTLVGVAHKSLPCGTQVALLYQGRTITVPVVDRGPFRSGTTYDLTAATATALGFSTKARIGAVRAIAPGATALVTRR
jgi:hypothetical protein